MQLTLILDAISQAVLYPVMAVLVALVVVTIVLLAMTIVEFFTERRTFTVSVPDFIRQLEESDCQGLPGTIARANIVKRQKLALMALFNARDLPVEARWNIAKRSVFQTDRHYDRLASAAELIAKIAPMVGLMGTLIPLGPGIDALSSGDLSTLAQSLLVAFDTTVVGLISAAFCLLIARIRRRWNADYANALEVMQATLFDKIADLEEAGDLSYSAPLELRDAQVAKKSATDAEVAATDAAATDASTTAAAADAAATDAATTDASTIATAADAAAADAIDGAVTDATPTSISSSDISLDRRTQ